MARTRESLEPTELESLKRQLEIHLRNLRILEEQAALYGPLDVPLELHNEIEHVNKGIDHLEKRIAELERRLKDPDEITEPVPEKNQGVRRRKDAGKDVFFGGPR